MYMRIVWKQLGMDACLAPWALRCMYEQILLVLTKHQGLSNMLNPPVVMTVFFLFKLAGAR